MSRLATAAACLLALVLTGAPPARAQDDPLVGDRPDFTESAITVAKGRVQVEAGATHTEAGDTESQELGEVLVRIGLTPRIELRVGLNSYVREDGPGGNDPSGFADGSIGVKIGLGQPGGWTTALLAGTTLGTGSDDFGDSRAQPTFVLAAQRDLTETLSVGANVGLGYGYISTTGGEFTEWSGSVAFGVALGEATGAFFELYGIAPSGSGGPETYYFDTGLTHAMSADLQLDLRVGTGLNSAADDFFVGAGIIWRR